MVVITTVGGDDSNSYADETEFKDWRVNRFPAIAAVLAATDDQISPALIVACRMLDDDFDWTGSAADAIQALTWPRTGMLTRNGFSISTVEIPRELKAAQCELTYQLLTGADLVSDNDALMRGIASLKAGSVAVSFQSQDSSTVEAVDMFLRRLGSDFNYLSSQISGEVRRLLVSSWYVQHTIKRPVLFGTFGATETT